VTIAAHAPQFWRRRNKSLAQSNKSRTGAMRLSSRQVDRIRGWMKMSKELDQEMFSDFVRALAFASHKHSKQRRKDVDASPYINHPIALVSILTVEAGICREFCNLAENPTLHDSKIPA
jgi:hypothetical protein